MFLCGRVPMQSACAHFLSQNGWFGVDASHISPPWYAASSHLGRGVRAGEGETGVGGGERDVLLSGCHHPARARSDPQVAGGGRIGLQLALFYLSVCFLPLPALGPLPQRKGVLKQAGPCADREVQVTPWVGSCISAQTQPWW